jgi:hypothetical protein
MKSSKNFKVFSLLLRVNKIKWSQLELKSFGLICILFTLSCIQKNPQFKEPEADLSQDGVIYDDYGFDSSGLHFNGSRYDHQGYDVRGFYRPVYLDLIRFHRNGTLFDDDGYTYFGFNNRFLHRDTGNEFDRDGYDVQGFNAAGLNRRGFNREGYYIGQNRAVSRVDPSGYNSLGFSALGLHYSTGTEYAEDGVDAFGFTSDGFDVAEFGISRFDSTTGFNVWGFNADGNHRNGTRYCDFGFDVNFFNREGVSVFGNFFLW